ARAGRAGGGGPFTDRVSALAGAGRSVREEDAIDGDFGRRPRLDAETRPVARFATRVDRGAAELRHSQHDFAVDAGRELVGAQLQLDGVVSVQAGRVGHRLVRERLPGLAGWLAPLPQGGTPPPRT